MEIFAREAFGPFNPQAPCGARQKSPKTRAFSYVFQSTGSLRSPTWKMADTSVQYQLSIHRLLAEPDSTPLSYHIGENLSIHRLLAEPDTAADITSRLPKSFQSTGSLRSPTLEHCVTRLLFVLSIHRLLAEPDEIYD